MWNLYEKKLSMQKMDLSEYLSNFDHLLHKFGKKLIKVSKSEEK